MKFEDLYEPAAEGCGSEARELASSSSAGSWCLPVDHLSATAISTFMQCPRDYQQQYILKRKRGQNSTLVLGSACHGAIGWGLQNPAMDPDEVAGYFAEYEWLNKIEDAGGSEAIEWKDDQEQLRIRGALMVKTYMDKVASRLDVVAVERPFTLDIPGIPVPIVGRVDITQSGTRPAVDIKTSKSKVTDIKPSWRIQGLIYQLAEWRAIDWHVLTKQVTPQVFTSLEAPELLQEFSEPRAQQTQRMIERIAWQINLCYAVYGADEDWDWLGITHQWACSYCSFKNDCPGWVGA